MNTIQVITSKVYLKNISVCIDLCLFVCGVCFTGFKSWILVIE